MRLGYDNDKYIRTQSAHIHERIQQFGGKLQGKLGFFDAVVVEPIPFEDEEEFKIIKFRIKSPSILSENLFCHIF